MAAPDDIDGEEVGDDDESVPGELAVEPEDRGGDGVDGRKQPGPRSSQVVVRGGGEGNRRIRGGGGGGEVAPIEVGNGDQLLDFFEREIRRSVRN